LLSLRMKPEDSRGEASMGFQKKYLLKGDPYHCQCQKAARLAA